MLSKGIENLKRYNCVSISQAKRGLGAKTIDNDSGFIPEDSQAFGTFPRRNKAGNCPVHCAKRVQDFEDLKPHNQLNLLTSQAQKLINFDDEFETNDEMTHSYDSSRVNDEEISSQFDHCESLLSDLDFGMKTSTPILKKSPKNEVRIKGMETIKRQMDNLTEMV